MAEAHPLTRSRDHASVRWLPPAIEAHTTTLTGLVDLRLLPGAGHRLHQEGPDTVNVALLGLLERTSW